MADLGVDDLRERVRILERRLRRAQALGVFLIAIVVASAAGTCLRGRPEGAGTVVAERFVVRDALGRERAVLGLDHPSSPGHSPVRLGLTNADSGSSAVLYLSDSFAGLTVSSAAQATRATGVQLFANPKAGGGLKVLTGARRPRVEVEATPGGESRLILRTEAGEVIFTAP